MANKSRKAAQPRRPRTVDLLAGAIPRPDVTVFNFEQCLWWLHQTDSKAMLVITMDHGEFRDSAPHFAQMAPEVAAQADAASVGNWGAPLVDVSRAALPEVVGALDACDHFLVAGLIPPRAMRRPIADHEQDALTRQCDAESRLWLAVVSTPFVDHLR